MTKAKDIPQSQPGNSNKIKIMAQSADAEHKDSNTGKSGVTVLGWRFNDAPAIVPFKKRRIQIAEVMRTPSPPPRSPSPQILSPPPTSDSPETSPWRQPSLGSKFASALSPSSRLPFSVSPSPRLRSSSGSLSPPPLASPLQQPAPSGGELNTAEGAMKTPFHDGEAVEIKEQSVVLVAPSSPLSRNSYSTVESLKMQSEHGAITSAKVCIDNDDMAGNLLEGSSEDANGHSSQDAMNGDGIDQDASPERLQGELLRSESSSFSRDDRLHWDLNTDMAAWDTLTEQAAGKNIEGAETPCVSTRTNSDKSGNGNGKNDYVDDGVKEQVEEDPEIDKHVMYKNSEFRQLDDRSSVEKDEATPPAMHIESVGMAEDVTHHLESKYEKQAKSPGDDAEGWNHIPEESEAEEHIDFGDSDCRDADDMGLDVDDRTSLMQEESNWKAEEGTYNNELGELTLWEGEAVSDAGETLQKVSSHDSELSEPSLENRATSGKSKLTGWDQLPEGFDNAEEAWRAAKEISSRQGGRGGSWANSGGRGSLSSSHAASGFGIGRGTARDGSSAARGGIFFRDRHADEVMRERDSFRHGKRLDDILGAHNAVRGRNLGRRGAGIFGRGRVGGWIDNQPGPMNQWGPGRHRPTSGFGRPANAAAVAAARIENSRFIVAPDGTITKSGSVIAPGRGGIQSTVSGSRDGRGALVQVGRGPADMAAGVHYLTRAGVGTDRIAGMNVRGRGVGPGAGPGLVGGMHDRGGSATRELMDRYRGGGMESRRSQSPRRSTHPLDHPNLMSWMPSIRPQSRVVRSSTPPSSHRSVREFVSTKNQCSSQPSPRWSTDKREADNYRDRDFKRPLSRSHVHSQRTSPHVVHGSSLMDERDRQVLAGTQQSPSLKGSLSSYLGKSGDGSLEAWQSKRTEGEDVKHTGSRSKDGDHGRSSPRKGDKDKDKGSSYKKDRERDDRRRDSYRSSSKDGRSTGGHEHAGTQEPDDDVAPRRRRLS